MTVTTVWISSHTSLKRCVDMVKIKIKIKIKIKLKIKLKIKIKMTYLSHNLTCINDTNSTLVALIRTLLGTIPAKETWVYRSPYLISDFVC